MAKTKHKWSREHRDWQKKRTANWRSRYYAMGLTYARGPNGKWKWIPKKVRPEYSQRQLRKKIMEARKK